MPDTDFEALRLDIALILQRVPNTKLMRFLKKLNDEDLAAIAANIEGQVRLAIQTRRKDIRLASQNDEVAADV